ncbi:hypothetical protein B0H16DRAFT_234872 [Mycena metata]|uniref:Uncharacterized protein n=1 Tax=Mycena metata TaxID=1033252 RepID=A0AAD7NPQ3_9AGAR|nr:hypothetical protein B0H16DRAFT_234872 [Mycena metata]
MNVLIIHVRSTTESREVFILSFNQWLWISSVSPRMPTSGLFTRLTLSKSALHEASLPTRGGRVTQVHGGTEWGVYFDYGAYILLPRFLRCVSCSQASGSASLDVTPGGGTAEDLRSGGTELEENHREADSEILGTSVPQDMPQDVLLGGTRYFDDDARRAHAAGKRLSCPRRRRETRARWSSRSSFVRTTRSFVRGRRHRTLPLVRCALISRCEAGSAESAPSKPILRAMTMHDPRAP